MAFLETVEDDSQHELKVLVSVHDKYLLGDGTEMYIGTCVAWCTTCRDFVLAEKLRIPEEIEESARRHFAEASSRTYDIFPAGLMSDVNKTVLAKQLEQARLWKIALTTRTSRPRCLECGACDFVPLPERHQWMNHPAGTGQKVRIRNDDYHHASMARLGRLYNTEGKRIPGRYESLNP